MLGIFFNSILELVYLRKVGLGVNFNDFAKPVSLF